MSTNTISTIHGTASDPTGGLTLAEYYVEKSYLKSRVFNSPLVQQSFFSKLNMPKRAGQFVKFTRRGKLRQPEVMTDATDPESEANLSYEQIHVPIEYINDVIGIGIIAQETSWLDLAKDAKEMIFEALMRYLNISTQGCMLAGRFKPGHRNSSGVTVGDATYPHFWTTPEASVSLHGGVGTFAFPAAPRYYANKKAAFADLRGTDRLTVGVYRRVVTRLRNSGAIPVTKDGLFVAVISHAIEEDLMNDDKNFAWAIRDKRGQDGLVKGHLADYGGIRWVLDDEPWTLALGGDQYTRQLAGDVHVSQVFGMDAFGVMRMGGKSAEKPSIKVQDISKTGNKVTFGFYVPHQSYVLNRAWCANVIGPVSEPHANG